MAQPDQPHPARCATLLRRQAPSEGWTAQQLADVIHTHCGHSRLRAHRLARDWTLETLVDKLREITDCAERLGPSRVSRWETGVDSPSASYQDALCRVYRTGPVELGLAVDFGDAPGTEVAVTAPPLVARPAEFERRDLLRGAVASAGGILSAPVLDAVSTVRRRMDETLSGSAISDTTVDYWQEIGEQYGRTYKSRSALPFLVDIVSDFAEIQLLTNQRLPSGPRRDLCIVAGRLAGLISMTMTNLGHYREARGWVHTARLAADESGDPVLRAWVATREAVAHLHFGDPHGAAIAARQAQLLAKSIACGAAAMAPAIEARALAAQGDLEGARDALRRAEAMFGRLSAQENVAYAFTVAQYHFYASNALTKMGDTTAAAAAQEAALSAFGPQERLDPTLVHLDRAMCMVRSGDVAGGATYASDVLLGLTEEYRPAIVIRSARALTAEIPPERRSTPAVRHFHDVLAMGA